jgi:hemerythrin-like domain-containing protein
VTTLLHAVVYVLHDLLNVLVQIANKMGLQKKKYIKSIAAMILRSKQHATVERSVVFHLVRPGVAIRQCLGDRDPCGDDTDREGSSEKLTSGR